MGTLERPNRRIHGESGRFRLNREIWYCRKMIKSPMNGILLILVVRGRTHCHEHLPRDDDWTP